MTTLLWCLTIVLQVLISQPFGVTSEELTCNQLDDFTVELSDGKNVNVHTTEFSISYGSDISAYSFTGDKNIKLFLNNAVINYKGVVSPQSGLDVPSETISWNVDGPVLGLAELQTFENNYNALLKSHLVFSEDSENSLDLPSGIKSKILASARSCILRSLCEKLKDLQVQIVDFDEDLKAFEEDIVDPNDLEEDVVCGSNFATPNVLRVNGNVLIEDAILEFTKMVREEDRTKIILPDLDKKFKTGSGIFKAKGRFRANNGFFKDLLTLKRAGDAVLTKNGDIYTLTSGFTLGTAFLQYDNYKFSYGILPEVSGRVSGNVNGLVVEVQITIDYSKDTCTPSLGYIQVKDFGTLNLSLTGLGALNNWVSKLLTFLTEYWREDIMTVIYKDLTVLANDSIAQFECELMKKGIMDVIQQHQ